jgi:hypothetical protein
MSYTPYQSASYRSKPQPVVKKFCKVCQDAGKPESEYTSHNVRETKDPNSKILCPTLLALECRNCFKKGHTVKYCSLLKKQQLREQTSANAPPKKQEQKQGQKQTQKNVFMLLESDGEDDQEEQEEPMKQKLAPAPVSNAALKKPTLNYKSIIAITEKQVKEEEEIARLARFRKQEDQYAKMKSKMTKSTWADAESSEDEDEDEEQAEN